MEQHAERAELPLIIMHGAEAERAQRRVAALLESAGARPEEVQHLIAAIEAGAVEGAYGEVAWTTTPLAGRSAEFVAG